jgi:multiple sugar transport system permease protein
MAVNALRRTGLYAVLVLWSLVCLVPIAWLVVTSIKAPADIDGYLPFVDFIPVLDAWRFLLATPQDSVLPRLVNSALIATASMGLTMACGAMAIYALTRLRTGLRASALVAPALPLVPGTAWALASGTASLTVTAALAVAGVALAVLLRRSGPALKPGAVLALLLSSRVLPPVVLALPLYAVGTTLGARDTRSFLTLVHTAINLPVAVWLLLPVLGPRASDEEEAAMLDGASHLAILFGILLPMRRAGVVAAGLVVFLLSWNEYLLAAYLAFDTALTLPPWAVGQLSMKEAQVGGGPEEVAQLAAATVLMMLPALAFAAVALRGFGRSDPG